MQAFTYADITKYYNQVYDLTENRDILNKYTISVFRRYEFTNQRDTISVNIPM